MKQAPKKLNRFYSINAKAVKVRLPKIKDHFQQKVDFLEGYADVYHLPKKITAQNLELYAKLLDAIDLLDKALEDHR